MHQALTNGLKKPIKKNKKDLMELKNVKVKIKKTKVLGYIPATTLPLKDDVNYAVTIYDTVMIMRQWWKGKDLEVRD
jgi:hypothetical protein